MTLLFEAFISSRFRPEIRLRIVWFYNPISFSVSILTTECHKSGRCSNAVEVPRGTGVSQRTNGPLFKGKLVSKLYFFSEGFFIYNLKIFTILFLVLELPKTTLQRKYLLVQNCKEYFFHFRDHLASFNHTKDRRCIVWSQEWWKWPIFSSETLDWGFRGFLKQWNVSLFHDFDQECFTSGHQIIPEVTLDFCLASEMKCQKSFSWFGWI